MPVEVISEAGTQATNWVLLTNEVTSDVAFHITEEVWEKFEPFMINSKAGPPALAETGVTGEVTASVGTRLLGPVMVKSSAGDEAPELGMTATLAKPGVTILAPFTCAESVWHGGVPFIGHGVKVEISGVPFHVSASLALKFVPVAVRVNEGPPAKVLAGTRGGAITGPPAWGAAMVNDKGVEVPPPGAGFSSVIWAVPAVATSDARMSASNSCVVGS